MRNIIIGLSIFFFALSGIVIYKTLQIPSDTFRYQNNLQVVNSKELSSKAKEISGVTGKEQSTNQTRESLKKARVLAVFGDGTFRSGEFVMNNNLKTAVQKLGVDIKASPGHRVVIEGHTDNIRPSSGKKYMDNIELSFLRANAVALQLVKSGIALERISVIGYGDTRPIASNNTSEGRARNRRVEVKLVPGERDF
jgi:outer membrane protein OmpA-like peptidoglycan-associated protein